MSPPSVWIVAGEESGDLQGAALARAILALRPDVRLAGLGGARMRDTGVALAADPTAHAATGVVEIVRKLPYFRRLLADTAGRILAERPAAVVLVDFPEFNMRLAARVGSRVPVVYYIPPQVWAWREGRVETIRKHVRKVVAIFPFEEGYYRDRGIDCAFVGHPLVEIVARERTTPRLPLDPGRLWIGLLPGSRSGEFARHWPLFREAAARLHARRPETSFFLSVPPHAGPFDPGSPPFPLQHVAGGGRDILRSVAGALLASGTVSLEAALLGCPHVAAYCVNPLTYRIARRMIRTDLFTMPNILAGREIVPELEQHEATPEALATALERTVCDPASADGQRRDLAAAVASLGGEGAAERAARAVLAAAGLSVPGAPG